MKSNRHIIERINLAADLPRGDFGIQEALGSWLREVAVPAIGEICDELIPGDCLLRLDQLELDLGVLEELDPESPAGRSLLRERLTERLRDTLGEFVWQRRREVHEAENTSEQHPQKERVSPGEHQEKSRKNAAELLDEMPDPRGRFFTAWLYFLEQGCRPWWYPVFPSPEEWTTLLVDTLQQYERARTQVQSLLNRSVAAERRLLGDARHTPLFKALLQECPGEKLAWETWSSVARQPALKAKLVVQGSSVSRNWLLTGQTIIWRWLLRTLSGTNVAAHTVTLLEEAVKRLVNTPEPERGITEVLALELLSEAATTPPLKKKLRTLADAKAKRVGKPSTPVKAEQKRKENQDRSREETKVESLLFQENSAPARRRPTTSLESSTSMSPPDHWYLQHAGVVLAHPFLEPLFTALGYWQKGAFADELAQQRAVFLTHYLATSDPAGKEEEMILPKLLCGRPLTGAAVVLTEPLTATETQEADEVLRSIIEHWPAVGDASPEGLREGFFAREARLLRRENDWELTVERKGQDILLGQLGWGISMVKCGWHEGFIKVSW